MPASAPQYPKVLLESFSSGEFARSFRFEGLHSVIVARTPDEVVPALQELEKAVGCGRHAAGFVSYEAASGLNPDLPAAEAGDLPLVWFGIFAERHECRPGAEPTGPAGFEI